MKKFLLIALCLCASVAVAERNACANIKVSNDAWIDVMALPRAEQTEYLETLAECIEGVESAQYMVDTIANNFLFSLDGLSEPVQAVIVDFVARALKVAADAGFSSSQHNYASIHNAQAGSPVSKLQPQDKKIFIYWTKKAAAQKEPRAVFNLAMRLGAASAVENVPQDFETAYILLTSLEQSELVQEKMAYVLPHVAEYKKNIEARLGAEKAQELAQQAQSFDFATLAPKDAS